MDIICKLFDRAETDNIARSLGNMMISGVDNLGRNAAYSAIVRHQLLADRTLVILQDSVTAERHRQLKALISACDKKIYDISLSESSDSRIDILSAFKRPEDKPIYRPEIFRELRPLDVMCYIREPLIRRKSRIE